MDIQELLRQKKAQMASKKASQIRTIKPDPGKHLYRILPSWRQQKEGEPKDPTFWHDYGQHFVRAEKGGKPVAFVCADKTFDQPCDVCVALGKAISQCNDDATLELLKQANAGQRFLMNVLHLSNTDEAKRKVPQVMEVGATVFNSIIDIMEDYGDVTDLDKGIDLIIKREGTGLDTEYTVLPSPKGARKQDPSVMERVTDLDAFAASASETQKAKAFANLSAASGLLLEPPKSTVHRDDEPSSTAAAAAAGAAVGASAPRAASMMTEVAEDAEFEDMPEDFGAIPEASESAEKTESEPAPSASEPVSEEDDLDALLAELG